MTPQEAQMQAAQTLSDILSQHNISHAFIGGFAVNVLGHERATTDIDVEIDAANAAELQGHISQVLIECDARFSQEHMKLFFTPTNHPELRVPVETLPIGELGLPRRLEVIRLGNSPNSMPPVPILRPSLLVLTKIKRCVHLIESTRPRSIVKFRQDLSDIKYLLQWLAQHNEKLDFAGYLSLTPNRLYSATRDLIKYWKETGEDEWAQLISSLLEQEDRQKIMAD